MATSAWLGELAQALLNATKGNKNTATTSTTTKTTAPSAADIARGQALNARGGAGNTNAPAVNQAAYKQPLMIDDGATNRNANYFTPNNKQVTTPTGSTYTYQPPVSQAPVTTSQAPVATAPVTPTTPTINAPNLGDGGDRTDVYDGAASRQDPNYIEYQHKPKQWTGQELADMYGFIFGEDQIREVLQQGTNARFNEWDTQMRRLRDNSLTDYAMANDSYLNTFRSGRQNAMQQGITRGQNLAQEMGALLSTQNAAGQNQTAYQQQIADIGQQRGTQLASDAYTAMSTQNEIAGNLAGIASQLYGYDVQDNTGYLSYLGQMGANSANQALAAAQQTSADASASYYRNAQNTVNNAGSATSGSADVINNLMSGGLSQSEATLVALQPSLYADIMAQKETAAQKAASDKAKKLHIQPTYNTGDLWSNQNSNLWGLYNR